MTNWQGADVTRGTELVRTPTKKVAAGRARTRLASHPPLGTGLLLRLAGRPGRGPTVDPNAARGRRAIIRAWRPVA